MNEPVYLDPMFNRWMGTLNGKPLLLGYESEIDLDTAEYVLLLATADPVKRLMLKVDRPRSTMALRFDPDVSCMCPPEDGVAFSKIWRDPLARCLWSVGKFGYLTNQYFRGNVLRAAEMLRLNPQSSWWHGMFDGASLVSNLDCWQPYVDTAVRLATVPREQLRMFEPEGMFISYRLELEREP